MPVISKVFEKLLIKRLKPIIQNAILIPDHQFGFRQKHSTIDQVHRITDVIEKTLEEKQICSALFLDVAQAFDKVWREGLIYKLNKMLPRQYVELLSLIHICHLYHLHNTISGLISDLDITGFAKN